MALGTQAISAPARCAALRGQPEWRVAGHGKPPPDTGALLVRLESSEQSRLPPQCFSPDGTRLIVWGHDTGSLHLWNLQILREELAHRGLDWNASSYPPTRPIKFAQPLEIEVLPGDVRAVKPAP